MPNSENFLGVLKNMNFFRRYDVTPRESRQFSTFFAYDGAFCEVEVRYF